MNWTDLTHIHRNRTTGLSNGGWAYDAYPELETLDAGKTITVARIDGPAVITCIHLTQHLIYKSEDERYTNEEKTLATRAIILEICFDDADTDRHFFHIDGCGHLIGRAWSICTAEPFFKDYSFIMEGNNEIRIDGEAQPRIDYLGTEDSFGFSWGFGNIFNGLYNGINYLDKRMPLMLSIYRFMGANAIRFNWSLDLRIDWSNEFRFSKKYEEFKARIGDVNKAGGGYVDYATTYYWYQDSPGFSHDPLPSLAERLKPVLHSGDAKS